MPKEEQKIYDAVIIGGGAAGLSAGIYAARYLMKTLLIMGKEPGGETATAWTVENYPGFKKIDGFDLIQNMIDQAKETGVELVYEEAVKIEGSKHCFTTHTAKQQFDSKTLILAFGAQRRHLGLPKEKELVGKGVSYCSTCDAPLFKNKIIAIVGGGDSSVKGSILAAQYSPKIYLITRGDELTPEPVNLERMEKLGNQVEVIYNNEVKEFLTKNGKLIGVKLSKPYQGKDELDVEGVLIEIGFQPRKDIPEMLDIEFDDHGYIKVDKEMKTNIDGVFACGDGTNAFGAFKQVVTAAATGAMAATSAYKDLGLHGAMACELHAMAPARVGDEVLALMMAMWGTELKNDQTPSSTN